MSAQKHHHTFAVIILIGVILLFASVVYTYYNPNSFLRSSVATLNKFEKEEAGGVYSSNFLKISILVPDGFKGEEFHNDITLTNKFGDIKISRHSTNFETLEEYYDNLLQLNSLVEKDREELNINGNKWIKSVLVGEQSGYQSSSYWVYPEKWTVYSISTTSPDLYDELDQIARSFRYTGE